MGDKCKGVGVELRSPFEFLSCNPMLRMLNMNPQDLMSALSDFSMFSIPSLLSLPSFFFSGMGMFTLYNYVLGAQILILGFCRNSHLRVVFILSGKIQLELFNNIITIKTEESLR